MSHRLDIFGEPNDLHCRHGCGAQMPSAQATAVIADSLQRLFGDAVDVRYFDVSDAASARAYVEMVDRLGAEGLSLPIVVLDDQIEYAGAIHPLRVVTAVARVLHKDAEVEHPAT